MKIIPAQLDQLPLARRENALDGDILIGIPFPAHTADRPDFGHHRLVIAAGVWASSLTGADQPLFGLPLLRGAA
jgi:hypothetical protein